MHQNIQCLRNKTLEVVAALDGLVNKPTVLCFSEHWLHKDEAGFTKLEGYKLASFYSRNNMEHGGTCIYVKEDLCFLEEERIVELTVEATLEMSCIVSKAYKLLVVCLYRRGLGVYDVFIDRLDEVLSYIQDRYLTFSVVIVGDFNINLLEANCQSRGLLDLMNAYNMRQCIFDATRVTVDTSTLIDNIFCRSFADCKGYVLNCALSDHHAQILCMEDDTSLKENDSMFEQRVFSKSRVDSFVNELETRDWDVVYNCSEANNAYNTFINSFKALFDRIFVIKKLLKSKKQNLWITKGIKISCKNKRILYYRKIRGELSSDYFREYCKILKAVIKIAKRNSDKNYIERSENKVKSTWNIIKKITGQTSGISSTNSVFNNFCEKYKEPGNVLNKLNDYFINSCPNFQNSDSKSHLNFESKTVQSIFLHETNSLEIEKIILKLRNKKSVGHDEVPISLLKRSAKIIAHPISYIINLCFLNGTFPDQLKLAHVKALYKKGSKDSEGNYRPISLLSNISKIFERALYERIMSFCERLNIISEKQNGFRQGKSTIRAIYTALTKVFSSLNEKKQTLAMLIDLSKAFDSVNHDILCKRLEMYGIRGVANDLIRSYLSGREQRVVERDEHGRLIKSEKIEICKGVPQGSILGPLLYILYTNEISDLTDIYTVLYADDTTLIFSEENNEMLLSSVSNTADVLEKYFSENDLLMNVSKTQLLLFGNRSVADLTMIVNKRVIDTTNSVKFLGMNVDARLDWKAHVEGVALGTARYSYALNILSKSVSVEAALMAYYAYVQSRLRYGLIFWGNSSDMHRILILQKRCLRNVFQMHYRESCRNVFINNRILTLVSMYILDAVLFVKDNVDLFQDNQLNHLYDTRHKSNLISEKCNFAYIQKNVQFSIVKIFNFLPKTVRVLPRSQLRSCLIKFLISGAFYSIDEFFKADEDLSKQLS